MTSFKLFCANLSISKSQCHFKFSSRDCFSMDSDFDRKKLRFLSVYASDYVKPPRRRVSHTEPYKWYLVLGANNISPPNEDGELFLEKCRPKNKVIEKLFKDPLDKKALYQNKKAEKRNSEYQQKYCNIERDQELYKEKLFEACEYVTSHPPMTTYLTAFRLPTFLRRDLVKSKPNVPITRLKMTDSVGPKLMSDYTRGIGCVGGLISETVYLNYIKNKEKT